MSTIRRDSVTPGEKVVAQGANAKVVVSGDVWGTVIAQGASATIHIGGYVHMGAEVIAQGSNANVKYHGRDPRAKIIAQGSNAEEIDLGLSGGGKAPPDRSGLEFGIRGKPAWREQMRVKERIWREGVATATPVNHDTVTIQKSGRPRGQWGT